MCIMIHTCIPCQYVFAYGYDRRLTYAYVSYKVVDMANKERERTRSREHTCKRLVDAAERLIARQGIAATSVEDITEAAGFSRGAFYSNFRSKKDLLFEVLRRDQARSTARFTAALDMSLPYEQFRAHVRALYATPSKDQDFCMSWTEGQMLGARDAGFQAKLAVLIAQRRDFVVRLIAQIYARAGRTPSVPLDALAMGFISLIEGVRLFAAACPDELPGDVAQSILAPLVDWALPQIAAGASGGAPCGR